MNEKSDLKNYSFNRFSQNGEDGIIEELIRRLKLILLRERKLERVLVHMIFLVIKIIL